MKFDYNRGVRSKTMKKEYDNKMRIDVDFVNIQKSVSLRKELYEMFKDLDKHFEHIISVRVTVLREAGKPRLKVQLHLPQSRYLTFVGRDSDLTQSAHDIYVLARESVHKYGEQVRAFNQSDESIAMVDKASIDDNNDTRWMKGM